MVCFIICVCFLSLGSKLGEISSCSFPEEETLLINNPQRNEKKTFEFERVYTPEISQGNSFSRRIASSLQTDLLIIIFLLFYSIRVHRICIPGYTATCYICIGWL